MICRDILLCDCKLIFTASLFANVLLDETISITLRNIYDEGKIETNIPRNVMKELLLLCTKHVHFTFNGDIYIQLDVFIRRSNSTKKTVSCIGKDTLMTHMGI